MIPQKGWLERSAPTRLVTFKPCGRSLCAQILLPPNTIADLVGAGWSPVWHFLPPHASLLSEAFVRWQRPENPCGSTCFCGLQSHGRLTLRCSGALLMSSLPHQQRNQPLYAPFRAKKMQLIQEKHYFWTGEFCWMLLIRHNIIFQAEMSSSFPWGPEHSRKNYLKVMGMIGN